MIRTICALCISLCGAQALAQDCTYALRMNAGPGGWGGVAIEVCKLVSPGEVCSAFTMSEEGDEEHIITAALGQLVFIRCVATGATLPAGAFSMHAVSGSAIYQWPGGVPDLGTIWAFQVNAVCNVPPLPPWDCLGALSLGTSGAQVTVHPGSMGSVSELGDGSQGCLGPEVSGFWMVGVSPGTSPLELCISTVAGGARALNSISRCGGQSNPWNAPIWDHRCGAPAGQRDGQRA